MHKFIHQNKKNYQVKIFLTKEEQNIAIGFFLVRWNRLSCPKDTVYSISDQENILEVYKITKYCFDLLAKGRQDKAFLGMQITHESLVNDCEGGCVASSCIHLGYFYSCWGRIIVVTYHQYYIEVW